MSDAVSSSTPVPNLSSRRADSEEPSPPSLKSENTDNGPPDSMTIGANQQQRNNGACIRCRSRHTRCPGGQPCSKCQMAKTKCEYVEYDKRLVVTQRYLNKLQSENAKLKKENASLRFSLNQERMQKSKQPMGPPFTDVRMGPSSPFAQSPYSSSYPAEEGQDLNYPSHDSINEVIHPSLDKHGRLVQSRTGEKVYVGSSSMTLFSLEIQNMAPSLSSQNLLHLNSSASSPVEGSSIQSDAYLPTDRHSSRHRETRILEKEGNAYNITLAKTNTRPGLSVNFKLPSYSYAILLVDTFINYNDGCFYFFNEGLVKRFLMNLYSGNAAENKKIIKRNISLPINPSDDENSIKKDADDDTILETIWFCKILLIFAIGEMYLGTESNAHESNSNKDSTEQKRSKKRRDTLPGSGFFYQASELSTGLFASGAIDNITKDGGIEVMLLYAFYLQVADCTIASYFYFGLALRSALILGWHVDADMENLNRFELEHRRRIWWTVYMYERMLSSKAGLPLSFADDSVSTELPCDFNTEIDDFPLDTNDVRCYYIFPSSEFINNCVTITQINAVILSSLYTKQPTANILPVVSDLVQRLFKWKHALPEFLRVDFSPSELKVSRLIVNLMTEYFQGMNLAVRPLLFHFSTKKLKELKSRTHGTKFVDLSKYSKNVLTLLNASFQASINTIKCIWALLPQNMVALFGWMDREYLFTSASTLILFNASFGVHDATRDHLDHALTLFTKMKKLGNYPAALRRAQLLRLIKVLDYNGVMSDLLKKHDDESTFASENPIPMDVEAPFGSKQNNFTNGMSEFTAPPVIPEPLQSDLDFIQFNNPVPSATRPTSNRHTPTIAASENLTSESVKMGFESMKKGGIFPNSDLAGIEGVTYLDEEQQLWNEITNDAGWLQPNAVPSTVLASKVDHKTPVYSEYPEPFGFYGGHTDENSQSYKPNTNANSQGVSMAYGSGAYSEIINSEFQNDMF